MRWIFVRNAVNFAVNFCKKCGEIFIFTAFTAITAFLTTVHRNHRISYKNLPKNLDPVTIDPVVVQNSLLYSELNSGAKVQDLLFLIIC